MDYIESLSDDKMEYLGYESTPSDNAPDQLFYYRSGGSYFTGEYSYEHYIGFYLKRHIFGISSFSICSSKNPTNSNVHPLTWKIIGSVDGKNWFVIDSHTNDNILNGYEYTAHINVEECLVRHLRFVSPTYFALRHLDFFGNLYPYNFIASHYLAKCYYSQMINILLMVIPILL